MQFSRFQELALYHSPGGFYMSRQTMGRGGDFITSPEIGGLFGQVIAQALDHWWHELGHPERFDVVEAGAGTGTLAATILEAQPACANALHYVLVERSMSLRAEQTGRLPLIDYEDLKTYSKGGPVFTNTKDLPEGPLRGVLLANELLDNMPVDIFEYRQRTWRELRVGLGPEAGLDEKMVEVEDQSLVQILDRLVGNPEDGIRIPYQRATLEWLERALGTLIQGRLVMFDYGHSTRWMANHDWGDWMRTFRNQRPGGNPLEAPGSQDITCDVAIDQLSLVRIPDENRSQADFLETFGLNELVADAREAWHARAAIGDMGAARARGRVQEGRALTDPNGLGAHRVLEWKAG